MSIVFKVKSADWSGKSFPNVNPFVAPDDMAYGFDFRPRSSRLDDLTGKTTITPKRVDQVGGAINVTDPSIVTTTADGMGINVALGYLQSSLPVTAIPVDGSVKFTRMVVGGWSGIAFPAEKVVGSAPTVAQLFDYGSDVGVAGYRLIQRGLSSFMKHQADIENGSTSLDTGTLTSPTSINVLFLTFDGVNWKLHNKTRGVIASGTNATLNVTGNPIAVVTTNNGGKIALGGNYRPNTTIHAGIPSIYQQAAWNRVLSDAEIEEQYQRTKSVFSSVGV